MVTTAHWVTFFPLLILVTDVTHFPRTGPTPTHLLVSLLTVDVFILSNQVRVSPMLAITVSSAIMGFELPEHSSGARGRVCCVRTGEALRTTAWVVMWGVSQRQEWQEPPPARQRLQGECVTSRSISQTDKDSQASFFALLWHWYVEYLFWHLSLSCKKRRKHQR